MRLNGAGAVCRLRSTEHAELDAVEGPGNTRPACRVRGVSLPHARKGAECRPNIAMDLGLWLRTAGLAGSGATTLGVFLVFWMATRVSAAVQRATPVQASGTFIEADRTIDGDRQSKAVPRPDWDKAHSLLLKLKRLTRVHSVHVVWQDRQGNYTVETAVSGADYTPLAENPFARWVRLSFTDAQPVAEIEVYEDTPLPEFGIEGVDFPEVQSETVVVSWRTTLPATAEVVFGISPERLERRTHAARMVLSHRLMLPGLKPGTPHFLKIEGDDIFSRRFKSQVIPFKTAGLPPLEFVRVGVLESHRDRMILFWQTNLPTAGKLYFGKSNAYDRIFQATEYGTFHRFVVDGLVPSTMYFFRMDVQDTHWKTPLTTGNLQSSTRELNVALGKPVTGTFTELPEPAMQKADSPPLARLTDGMLDYFKSMAASQDPDQGVQWAMIDLQDSFPVRAVITYWRALSYSRNFSISLSEDGKTWETVASDLDARDGADAVSEDGSPMKIAATLCYSRRARYVRLSIPKGSARYSKWPQWKGVHLFEIKVLPEISVEVGE